MPDQSPAAWYKSLFVQVVVAPALGIVLGMYAAGFAIGLKFFSDAFLKLISMIVFCVVVHGIAGAGDLKKVGRVGGKALLYFEVMRTVALKAGLILAYVIRPGVGMNINTATLNAHALSTYADNAHKLQGGGFILNTTPTTSFDASAWSCRRDTSSISTRSPSI